MTSHRLLSKSYTEDAMSRALADVRSKNISLRAAAKKYGVPTSSLSDRNTGRVHEGSKWGRSPMLTIDQERTVIEHAMKRAELGIGFTKSSFLRFVGQFGNDNGVYFKDGTATEKWWRGLKKRHLDFSLRSPEATSSGRHVAMTRNRICSYFAALKDVLLENTLSNHPERIWNMDETGLSLAHKPAKVFSKKGSKCVHSKVSCNRELVTVIACGNASGKVIPPHVILPGKSERVLKGYDINFAPAGTNLSVSETGWTKEGIGRLWFTDTFIPNISKDRPQLLIFDGHGSHNHIEFVEIARAENIILLELPSKTSHWTQPFDRTVFKSLKSNWNSNIQTFMSDTGVSVGHAQFFRLLKRSWHASMTVDNISNGFVATGICPYNPGAIPNIAYAPSELYVEDAISSPTATTTSDQTATLSTPPSATPTRPVVPLTTPPSATPTRPVVPLTTPPSATPTRPVVPLTTPPSATPTRPVVPLTTPPSATPTRPVVPLTTPPSATPTRPVVPLTTPLAHPPNKPVAVAMASCSAATPTTTIPSTILSADVVSSGEATSDLTATLPTPPPATPTRPVLSLTTPLAHPPNNPVTMASTPTIVSVDIVTSGEAVIDLPVKLDENGTLCMLSDDTDSTSTAGTTNVSNVSECTTDMALRVVESALTDEMKHKYMDAFNRGKELDDSLYTTWKMYYQKTASSAAYSTCTSSVVKTPDLFSLPMQKKKTTKRKHIGQYFVISSDEAYNEMKKAKEDKALKQQQIQERKLIRTQIKEERELIKKEKALKKATKK